MLIILSELLDAMLAQARARSSPWRKRQLRPSTSSAE